MNELANDLHARISGEDIEAVVQQTLEPIQEKRAQVTEALNVLEGERRELEAQAARLDQMIDAARLRRRPGRKPGKTAPREPVPV